jgi:hypothetical protein
MKNSWDGDSPSVERNFALHQSQASYQLSSSHPSHQTPLYPSFTLTPRFYPHDILSLQQAMRTSSLQDHVSIWNNAKYHQHIFNYFFINVQKHIVIKIRLAVIYKCHYQSFLHELKKR